MAYISAEFKVGEISITKNQVKKFRTQMTKSELDYLTLLVKGIGNVKLTDHAKEKNITIILDDIQKELKSRNIRKQILEFNVTNNDKRVLIRGEKVYQAIIDGKITDCNLCFVISLISKKVVTAYYNSTSDYHKTINYKRYNKNLDIV